MVPRGINPSFPGLFPCRGQVPYAVRTRAPVVGGASSPLPLDLHVLGLPLAFILSQDQTLHRCSLFTRPNDLRNMTPRPRFSRSNSLYSLPSHPIKRTRFSPQYFNEPFNKSAGRPTHSSPSASLSGCKYTTVFLPDNFFFEKKEYFFQTISKNKKAMNVCTFKPSILH